MRSFGWGYFFLTFGPWEGWPNIPDEIEGPRGQIQPNLLTRDLVKFITDRTTELPDITATVSGAPGSPAVFYPPGAEKFAMMQLCSSWIGHLLLTLIIGFVGGLISLFFTAAKPVKGPES